VDEQPILVDPNILQESLELRVETQINRYLSAPKKLKSSSNTEIVSRGRWEALNSAIISATSRAKEKLKNDPKFKYPHYMIANLHEFNQLRYEFTLNGTKSPGVSASLATAKSAIRCAPKPGEFLLAPRSGIYLSRNISKQARHVLNHKELFLTQSGNHSNHQSILDDIKIREALYAWVASKTLGEVSFKTMHIFFWL
jgi:hypothetical protein